MVNWEEVCWSPTSEQQTATDSDTENRLMVTRWEAGKGEEIKNYSW